MNLEFCLENIENIIDYRFKNRLWLLKAITHRSFASHFSLPFHYERLEFLGDSVLQLFITRLLFEKFSQDQGGLTKMRAHFVSRKTLSSLVVKMGLEKFLLVQKNLRNSNGNLEGGFVGDFFESITAAIYMDGGSDSAYSFLEKIYETYLNWEIPVDYKSYLQEICLKKVKKLPSYDTIQSSGGYFTKILLLGEEISSGLGPSKKKAEQVAAKSAIEVLKKY